jgi:phosphopantothenoylcysteine decarboxylase/phosphopantothenate--cysteine ligase
MRVLVTAGPTREYLDPVRFISNASSGRMGFAIASAARRAGHDVTLLAGPVQLEEPEGVTVVRFATCSQLGERLAEHFPSCDALVMAAAVGDYRPETCFPTKLRRRSGPISVRLYPTEDLLAGVAATKRDGQQIVAFAVEDGTPEQIQDKARAEMAAKGADYVVVNPPAAMEAADSEACILSRTQVALDWAPRPKEELARQIVALLSRTG